MTGMRARRATSAIVALLGAFVSLSASMPAVARDSAATIPTPGVHAAFGDVRPAADVRTITAWVAQSNDHGDAPFLLVDKRNARLFAFDARARLVASTPVLLGAARGDDSVPGIGDRKLSEILPHERTTPAGRFVGEAGRNLYGEDIVWVDYDAAVSMHRVRAKVAHERRLERLATPTVDDNRISYGCINVPSKFYDAHVSPLFAGGRKAMIYVLPETRSLHDVFPTAASLRG